MSPDVRFVPIGDLQPTMEYDCVGKLLKIAEHHRETSPQKFSSSGRRRWGAACCIAVRKIRRGRCI